MGALVYAAASEALRGRGRLAAAVGAFLAAGAGAAVLGLLEFVPWMDVEPWLAPFKPLPTTVGGVLRLSGSFEYANGAALYFELALPVLLGALIAARLRRAEAGQRRWRAWLGPGALVAGLGVYSLALLLTQSRAALVGLAAGLAALAGLALLRARRAPGGGGPGLVLRPLGLLLAVLLAAGAYLVFTQPAFSVRLTTVNDRAWYQAALTAPALGALAPGQTATVPVTVRNAGPMIWRAQGPLAVHLSYHWATASGQDYVVFEGARTTLPYDLAPGAQVTVPATLQAPPQPGTYRLQWDLVQERVTWFSVKSPPQGGAAVVAVQGPAIAAPLPAPTGSAPPVDVASFAGADTATVSRLQLWRVALRMFLAHPLTGVGPDGFRNLYGPYAGVTTWNPNIYTNNTYLEMFANLGLPGGLAFLWLAATILWQAGRRVLRAPAGPAWALGLGATAALAAFFAHGFVDYFLFSTPLYTAFWFLAAVALAGPRPAALPAATDP